MNIVWLTWLIPVLALLGFTALHLILVRVVRPSNAYRFLMILALICLPLVALSASAAAGYLEGRMELPPANEFSALAHALGMLVVLCLPFLSFYSMVDHSVRVRITVDMCRMPDESLGVKAIVEKYDPRSAAVRRLEKMVLGAYFERAGAGYQLTDKGWRTANLLRRIR